MTVRMLADSGAYMMAINETIQRQLQSQVKEKRKAQMPACRTDRANGSIEEYDVVGPH